MPGQRVTTRIASSVAPGARRLPPPPGSSTAGAGGRAPRGQGCGGSGVAATCPAASLPLGLGPLLLPPGSSPSLAPLAGSRLGGAAFRRGVGASGPGCVWRAVGGTARPRRAELHTLISSGPFAKCDFFLSTLAFWSFSHLG